MNETATNFVWLACPKCRWRREFPQAAVQGEMRCRQCGTTVVESPLLVEGVTMSGPPAAPAVVHEDALTLEPVELPPVSGVQHVMTPSTTDYQLAPIPTAMPPRLVPSDVPRGSVSEQKPRDDVVTPPRRAGLGWAFTNNIVGFPFQKYALAQWIFSAIGLALIVEFILLSIKGFMSMSVFSGLQGCAFCILACGALLAGGSYALSCLQDIVVNTAHNVDKARDWPDANLRERVSCMLRVTWLAVVASTLSAGIAGMCNLVQVDFLPVFAIIAFLSFPILLLAALEADAFFVPISRPIFRSLRGMWQAWTIFYLLTGLLWAGGGFLTWQLFNRSPLQMPWFAAPAWAAAIFIYGRLLGRLAWFILRQSESDQDGKAAQRMLEQQRWEM